MIITTLDISCCVMDSCGTCGVESPGKTRFRIKNYTLKALTGSTVISVTNQSVASSSLAFVLLPEYDLIARMDPVHRGLYACSPLPPTATQNVTSFTITSNADFVQNGNTIAAGQSLNDLFLLDDGVSSGSLSMYLQSSNIDATIYDYILKLLSPVTAQQTHTFTIRIVLSDQQSFELTTLPIDLLPS